jgi:hypothetical protein
VTSFSLRSQLRTDRREAQSRGIIQKYTVLSVVSVIKISSNKMYEDIYNIKKIK